MRADVLVVGFVLVSLRVGTDERERGFADVGVVAGGEARIPLVEHVHGSGGSTAVLCDIPTEEIRPGYLNNIEDFLNENNEVDIKRSALLVNQVAPENIVSIRRYKGWISYWVEGEGEYRIHLE